MASKKNVKKFPHIFHFWKWKIVQNFIFWENLSRLAFLEETFSEFSLLGYKLKNVQIWG